MITAAVEFRRTGWSVTSHWSVMVPGRSKVRRTTRSEVVAESHREHVPEAAVGTTMVMTMTVLPASTMTIFQIQFAQILYHDFVLNRRFPVGGQINGFLQGQIFVLLAKPILDRPGKQSNDELVQQQTFQMFTKLAVHGQALQPGVPRLDILSTTLLGPIELGPFPEDRNLRNELLS